MKDLQPVIFLVPLIVLSVVGLLYFISVKKATDKKAFNKFIFTVIVFAFLVNFTWELIQLPLYKNPVYDMEHIAFCALASLADVLMVLLLYLALAFIFKNIFWMQHPKWPQVIFLIVIGGAGAVLSELRHLSLGTWEYKYSMPLIPVINVGISPVIQFMVLPLLIYLISAYRVKKSPKNIH